jgi:5-(carboxyamino)imidazole ribonucleotide synthase
MKVGILGGGQLGRMLWEASQALKRDFAPSPVFHETKLCPAGFAGAEIVEGKVEDTAALSRFFKNFDTFAIENEFVHLAALKAAWEMSRSEKSFILPKPSWLALEIAQDKLEQKKFFVQNKFPTSEFVEITKEWFLVGPARLQELHTKWQGLVIKKARMGYDGKGNWALPAAEASIFEDLAAFAKLQAFCESAFAANSRVYAEKFVPFQKEVALVSARSYAQDYGHYPLIETVQKKGVCYLAFKALQSESLEKQAAEIAQELGNSLDLLGTYAVEFFVTSSGALMVNEMAPRVHNSGHFTQTAARSSQFEMHLKAYVQETFRPDDFRCAEAFAMVNLLGPDGLEADVRKPSFVNAYWYDKERTTPGRKLGHIISRSAREADLPKLLEELQQQEQSWQESLSRKPSAK